MTTLTRRGLLAALPVAALAWGTAAHAARIERMARPKDLDLSLSKPSRQSLYLVNIAPMTEKVRIGKMHSWTLNLTTANGRPVETAQIAVGGGMPAHGHGFPTAPKARALGGGQWVIEGMKFSMPGWWVIDLTIAGKGGTDDIRFNYGL